MHNDTLVITGVDGSLNWRVFVYYRSSGVWSQQTELTDPSAGTFGAGGVAVYNNTIAVGCPDQLVGQQRGSALIFTRTGSSWSKQATLTASDASPNQNFGSPIALYGDILLAGRVNPYGSGKAYLFLRNGSTWTEVAKLDASGVNIGYTSASIALQGTSCAISISGAGTPVIPNVLFFSNLDTMDERTVLGRENDIDSSIKVTEEFALISDYAGYAIANHNINQSDTVFP